MTVRARRVLGEKKEEGERQGIVDERVTDTSLSRVKSFYRSNARRTVHMVKLHPHYAGSFSYRYLITNDYDDVLELLRIN